MHRLAVIVGGVLLCMATTASGQPPPSEAEPNEAELESESETDADVESESETDADAESESETAADAEPDTEAAETDAEPERMGSGEEVESEVEVARREVIPLLDPELQPDPEPEPEPEPVPEVTPGHGPPLVWDERWGHWGIADQVALGVLLASTVAFQILGPRNGDDPWVRTSALDETVRDAFRVNNEVTRQRIRDASDVFLSITVAWPLLFDGLASALWYHQSPKVARELSLMSVETQFITASIQSLANVVSSRRRPYVQDCGTEIAEDDRECRTRVRWRSFFSGHTSQAFTAAATTCVYHARMPLYGGGTTEAMPCLAMMTLAAATGLFRIMGDNHWVTDVLTGAAMGITIGTVVPALRMRSQRRDLPVSIVPHGLGVGVVGAL